MEQLPQLVARLEHEHAALQQQLSARREAHQRLVDAAVARAAAAGERRTVALEQTQKHGEQLERLADRFEVADRRGRLALGRLWMIRHTAALMGCFTVGVGTWPVFIAWGQHALFFVQGAVLAAALLVIPRRR